jgi:prepilin-type N-terminal cleavage/methylation domain-containing protein/prepilin-type processing-associated H-X9-DG protein
VRKAFTLVELLVVIAIIAIIAAIAFPVLAKASKRAGRTECASNFRQIGQAITSYCGDWDERYPWAYGSNAVLDSPTNRPAISEILQPYAKSDVVFRCPSDIGETFLRDPGGFHRRTPPFHKMTLSSYMWNGVRFGGPVIAGRSTGDIRRPTEAYLSGEIRPWHGEYLATDYYFKSPALFNVLYCDGHIAGKTAVEWHAQEDAEFD